MDYIVRMENLINCFHIPAKESDILLAAAKATYAFPCMTSTEANALANNLDVKIVACINSMESRINIKETKTPFSRTDRAATYQFIEAVKRHFASAYKKYEIDDTNKWYEE